MLVGGDGEPDVGFRIGESEVGSPVLTGEPAGDPQQSVSQPFWFPPEGVGAGQGEQLQPGCELAGEHHDRDPDLVLLTAVEWEIRQASGFGCPDAVLAAGSAAVPQFQRGELPAAGVGRECGQPVPVRIGEPQLGARVRSFGVDIARRASPRSVPRQWVGRSPALGSLMGGAPADC